MKHTTTNTIIATALVLASCGGGGGTASTPAEPPAPADSTFAFETSNDVEASVRVTVDGEPREFAVVQIVDAMPHPGLGETIEDVTTGGFHFQGATDADGRITTSVVLPAATGDVDVVVLEPGTAGPYTVPEFRNQWGPFAPAARVTVSRTQLADLELELWTR